MDPRGSNYEGIETPKRRCFKTLTAGARRSNGIISACTLHGILQERRPQTREFETIGDSISALRRLSFTYLQVLNDVENCCGLPETVAIQIMLDISAAVEYLHEHSLTHRDLKPENIVLQQINNKVVFSMVAMRIQKNFKNPENVEIRVQSARN